MLCVSPQGLTLASKAKGSLSVLALSSTKKECASDACSEAHDEEEAEDQEICAQVRKGRAIVEICVFIGKQGIMHLD